MGFVDCMRCFMSQHDLTVFVVVVQELWALIMDAGTAYTAQTYNLTGQFLPKEWIMEKWEEGFYITAMAGSNSGWSLVAMSKGTPYTQQSYKVGTFFSVNACQLSLYRDGSCCYNR